jgi:Pyruvate/2-oxoacid:ferredoxin oxidoreductase delta subunit
MDFRSFVEGPLLRIIFLAFMIAITIRIAFFFYTILKSSTGKDSKWKYLAATLSRSSLPFHNGATKKPVYATLRYIFHVCLIVTPIWLSGHIALWEESRFEWSWTPLPDTWADWMTLLLLGLSGYFIIRRTTLADIRRTSSEWDYLLIVITALPFVTGYFLTHGSLNSIPFFENNMWTIHVLSGEVLLLTVVFLFCRTRLNVEKCIGCASCEISCPTGTLESSDKEKLRTFTFSHYQCICCGSCVKTCPEDAAELRHELTPRRFFQIAPKQEIQSVELRACKRCGALYDPEPQVEKIMQIFPHDYILFCPRCRKVNFGDFLQQFSPRHAKSKKVNQREPVSNHVHNIRF